MYIDSYIFFIALTGMVILLTYKVAAVRSYDKANTNYVHFNPFPRTKEYIAIKVHQVAHLLKIYVLIPFGEWLFRNIVLIIRGVRRSLRDMRTSRKRLGDMIDTSGNASGYIQKIIDQKKKIQRKLKRELKD